MQRSSLWTSRCAGRVHFAPRGGEPGARGVEQLPVGSTDCSSRRSIALSGSGRERGGARRASRPRAGDRPRPGAPRRGRAGSRRAAGPSSTLPSIRSRASARATSGTASRQQRIAPAEQRRHLTHPRQLAADPVEVVGGPAARAPAPRPAPAACAGDELQYRARTRGLERLGGCSGAKGDGVPARVWAGTPSGASRSAGDHPACSSSRTIC